MKKKILVSGPLLSASGYGKMCQFAIEALRASDKYDIYVNITTWGRTGWLFGHHEYVEYVRELESKTQNYASSGGKYDLSLQITIPNEWKRLAETNIGYTAGIETHVISPAWLEPSAQMDKIITISNFAKSIFTNTIFNDQAGNQIKVLTPIDVVYFPFVENKHPNFELDLPSEFNFLSVNQWGPRKNMEVLISSFVEEFRNEDVGLVIKANVSNDSTGDRLAVEQRLNAILAPMGQRKCKVRLVHGRLSDEQMAGLYSHPRIKAFVTATHGEGFGLPIFEAANSELPVVATDWSGHLEFLVDENDKKVFGKVEHELKLIDQSHVWPGVMEKQAGWAYPTAGSLRSRMREVYKDHGRFKSWAKKLTAVNKVKFEQSKVYDSFIKSIESVL